MLLLRIDWLEIHGAERSETSRTSYAGVGVCVKTEDKCDWCRRVIVQDMVILPARSERDVTG